MRVRDADGNLISFVWDIYPDTKTCRKLVPDQIQRWAEAHRDDPTDPRFTEDCFVVVPYDSIEVEP